MSAKIAIIEDDQPIREMYQLKLASSGYDVQTAGDGVQGLKLLEDFEPDIALLDLMMPEMNGEEVLEKFRKLPNNEKTKVIILTNISQDEATKDLSKLNVTDYIIKANHTPTQVIEIVEKALGKSPK